MNYDVQDGEYTCPICERLSNTVLPVLPPLSSLRLEMKTYCFLKKEKRQKHQKSILSIWVF